MWIMSPFLIKNRRLLSVSCFNVSEDWTVASIPCFGTFLSSFFVIFNLNLFEIKTRWILGVILDYYFIKLLFLKQIFPWFSLWTAIKSFNRLLVSSCKLLLCDCCNCFWILNHLANPLIKWPTNLKINTLTKWNALHLLFVWVDSHNILWWSFRGH
jgi:hypothetical protein